jgi:hypothetical protein
MNMRLSKEGYNEWYWQMKWNKTELYSSDAARSWLVRYVSFEFDQPLRTKPIRYEWSLSLKHIMSMHDSVYGNFSDNHKEYSVGETNREAILSPMASDDNILLILEDDAIFVPFFKQKMLLTFASLPPAAPWIVWIGGCLNAHSDTWNNNTIKISYPLPLNLTGINFLPFLELKPIYNSRCTTGYALNKAGARLILEEMEKNAKRSRYRPIDRQLSFVLEHLQGRIQSFWSEPVLSYQSNKAVIVVDGDDAIVDEKR